MAQIRATASSSSSPKPSTPRLNYHVFLSFRGADTRTNFTDHLYAALKRKGIVTFRDDEELERGGVISEKLINAIEESMFAIVVLSHNYASSSWCLDELQKIIESRKLLGQTVFPVFYGVDPSVVRHQNANFATAFEEHERKFANDKVKRWREALTKVANLAGWDTSKHKHEAKIIEHITDVVWTKLHDELPSNFDNLVGIQSKLDEMIPLLKIGLSDICFIGIWGMGGVGKTTLARVIFVAIQSKFEICCFLDNIKEELERNGLVHLQRKLLSHLHLKNIEINNFHEGVKAIKSFFCNKKVLIVLDDINHTNQLENLAGNKFWFGAGSRIIITTRDIHLLREYEHFKEYNIETLNNDESLKLLCQKAFKNDYPEEGYLELSNKVIEYARGLPLALKVVGSFLCGRSQSDWRDMLDMMKEKDLHKDILKTLRISFDGLEHEEWKTVFLDIACFFNWKKKPKVTRILKNCGFHPTIAIKVLMEKSLLSCYRSLSGEEYLYMHDLLQEMGRNIVLQESPNDAAKCSRLWSPEKIDLVMNGNKGTDKVQGIFFDSQLYKIIDRWRLICYKDWHQDCFLKMSNLRLLYLNNVDLNQNLNSLPSALKVFIWKGFYLKEVPHIGSLSQLEHLDLRHNVLGHPWHGRVALNNLKFIDFSHSLYLIKTPDFGGTPNLETLILKNCKELVMVHDSVGHLKMLVELNFTNCKKLVTLPSKLKTSSLEKLILYGCSKLEKLPKFGKCMTSLSIFDATETDLKEVPSSIVRLINLKELSFQGSFAKPTEIQGFHEVRELQPWKRIIEFRRMQFQLLKSVLGHLSLLKKLDLSYCDIDDGIIPDDLSGLSSLEELDLVGNTFVELPRGCFSGLLKLHCLNLSGCELLQHIPLLPPNITRVDASPCYSMVPLKDSDIQHLYAPLVSKDRSLSVASHEEIIIRVPEDDIPSWFEQRTCWIYKRNQRGGTVCIVIDIPCDCDDGDKRERSTIIAVCLALNDSVNEPFWQRRLIKWRFKAGEDHDSTENELMFRNLLSYPETFLAFIPHNHQNCQPHQGANRCQLELQVTIPKGKFNTSEESESESEDFIEIGDCGWRLI